MKNNLFFWIGLLVHFYALAAPHKSDFREVPGVKYPNNHQEGTEALLTTANVLTAPYSGFTELLPYVLRSPDQEEAGSCLYMSLTGIAEWWLAKLNPSISRLPEGPLDLSERYLMNLAGMDEASNSTANWKTDSIYLFNKEHVSVLNQDYRFTKGFYTHDSKGDVVISQEGEQDVLYDASFNWINELDQVNPSMYVSLPHFERDVLFADPQSNQWNVGVTPENINEKIMLALKVKKAPVQVIYNHFGYWHAVNILGFDESMDNGQCPFVTKFRKYMVDEPKKLRIQASTVTDQAKKTTLINKAVKFEKLSKKLELAYQQQGGCSGYGVYYVRDSIYEDKEGPTYDYDLSRTGDEAFYTKPIVVHEFDWVKYMVNHVTQIYIQ